MYKISQIMIFDQLLWCYISKPPRSVKKLFWVYGQRQIGFLKVLNNMNTTMCFEVMQEFVCLFFFLTWNQYIIITLFYVFLIVHYIYVFLIVHYIVVIIFLHNDTFVQKYASIFIIQTFCGQDFLIICWFTVDF